MASRRKYPQTFKARVNGEDIIFHCWTTDTRMGMCETAHCTTHGITDSKYSWCNRPWQRFDYETALRRAIDKLPKELQQGAREQIIEGKAAEEEKAANEMVKSFQKVYDDCSPRQKEMLANSGIHMESKEDVERVKGLMLLGQLMGI